MDILTGVIVDGEIVYKLYEGVKVLTPLDKVVPNLGMRYGSGGMPWRDESFQAEQAPDTPATRAKIQQMLARTVAPF